MRENLRHFWEDHKWAILATAVIVAGLACLIYGMFQPTCTYYGDRASCRQIVWGGTKFWQE